MRAAREQMRRQNYDAWVEVYERVYGKKLVYAEGEREA